MQYRLEWLRTRSATGFYQCVPDPQPDLETGLKMLADRPGDSFLRKYLLQKLLELENAKIAALVESSASAELDSLLAELPCQACGAETGKQQPEQGNPASDRMRRQHREEYYRNLHEHRPLFTEPSRICSKAELVRTREMIARRRGILARKRAEMEGKTQAGESGPLLPEIYRRASAVIERRGLALSCEMRHEASLSPIALLREWQVYSACRTGPQQYELSGKATAYGRGLSLAQARVSCAMELIERAAAYAVVESGGEWGRVGANHLLRVSYTQLRAMGRAAIEPGLLGAGDGCNDIPLYWLEGKHPQGETVLVPAQAAYLFLNLDEPDLFDSCGSTGLAAGATAAQAKLAGMIEVIERDAHATMPFRASDCFILGSRDEKIQGLLDDYRWRGIHVQFQDITTEIGVPVYRCFVQGFDGIIAQSTGAGLCGAKAALAALTETPWPYSWASGARSPSAEGLADLPLRELEALPDYSCGSAAADCELLEAALGECGLAPVYVDLGRPELEFPVYRVFVPGLEMDPELDAGPSPRLVARGY